MKVKELMEKNVVSVDQETPYIEVAKLLYEKQISGVPVTDERHKVIGMVSEKDLYKVLYPFYQSFYENPVLYTDLEARESKAVEIQNKPIRLYMSKEVFFVHPDDPIMKAGSMMLAKCVSRLPVIENGDIVGIISRKMIYRAIFQQNFSF